MNVLILLNIGRTAMEFGTICERTFLSLGLEEVTA